MVNRILLCAFILAAFALPACAARVSQAKGLPVEVQARLTKEGPVSVVKIAVANNTNERIGGFEVAASLPQGATYAGATPAPSFGGLGLGWSQPAGLAPIETFGGYEYRFTGGAGTITVEVRYWGSSAGKASVSLRAEDGLPPEDAPFEASYQAGVYDPAGNFLGGTEVTHLTGHQGKLFAGAGYWMDVPGSDPSPGPQILVLDSPTGQWRQDAAFPQRFADRTGYVRVSALRSVTFTTDGAGRPLSQPVSMLVAGFDGTAATVQLVASRDDQTGRWTEMPIDVACRATKEVRSLLLHKDRVTGVDRLFAGTRCLGVISGVYDPTVAGRIRWDLTPEPGTLSGQRHNSLGEANGVLYSTSRAWANRRIDGEQPRWEVVYTDAASADPEICGTSCTGMRGTTAVAKPDGSGEMILVGVEGKQPAIVAIDPTRGHEASIDLDLVAFLRGQWGRVRSAYGIVAYNNMVPVVDPRTGEQVLLIGLEVYAPDPSQWNSTWYLVRHADGRYDLKEVRPLPHPTLGADRKLYGLRAILVSPFPADGGKTVYMGGYDCNLQSFHNTGWLYRAGLNTVLSK